MTPTYILVPGMMPSRELLAVWGLFPFHRHMTETELPEPGWICSPSDVPFDPAAWSWQEQEAGYWRGERKVAP